MKTTKFQHVQAIRYDRHNKDGFIILLAGSTRDHAITDCKWFISDANHQRLQLKKHINRLCVIKTDTLLNNGWRDQHIFCEYQEYGERYRTEGIVLNDIDSMMKAGINFQDIEFINHHGNIAKVNRVN